MEEEESLYASTLLPTISEKPSEQSYGLDSGDRCGCNNEDL